MKILFSLLQNLCTKPSLAFNPVKSSTSEDGSKQKGSPPDLEIKLGFFSSNKRTFYGQIMNKPCLMPVTSCPRKHNYDHGFSDK